MHENGLGQFIENRIHSNNFAGMNFIDIQTGPFGLTKKPQTKKRTLDFVLVFGRHFDGYRRMDNIE